MKQISFSQAEFQRKKRLTKREVFLAEMEQIMPWAELLAVVEPHYPKGKRGRPPIGLERMLRVYLVQQWNNLSDEGVEDAITDSQALRAFVGIDLSREAAPDATTVLQFRHLLEAHGLTKKLFEAVNAGLSAAGLMMREDTIADATIIAAPPSVKNEAKARDPDMHQTKKGNQWQFGMKAHIGVDAASALVHTVVGTAANEADVTQTEHPLHGDEKDVFLDGGYTGAEKREELKDRNINWQIAMKRGKLKAVPEETLVGQLLRNLASVKASIRSKVEHPPLCQRNIARQITDQGVDYLLAVKGNQPPLLQAIETDFIDQYRLEAVDRHRQTHKSRGRIVSQIPSALPAKKKATVDVAHWPASKTIGLVDSLGKVGDEESNFERRYYTSSHELTAEQLAVAVRGHWAVENRLRWALDVSFAEDASTVSKDNAPQNLSHLTKIVLNLTRLDTTAQKKTSLRRKRKEAAWDGDFRVGIIGLIRFRQPSADTTRALFFVRLAQTQTRKPPIWLLIMQHDQCAILELAQSAIYSAPRISTYYLAF